MKIEIRDLHKSFGKLKVFTGLNLTIEAGEISVIMGRSGTGKSVLLKHLVGLIRPDQGEILIDGQNIVGLSERELYPIRIRFGMIFQNGGMLQSLNVADNVGLPLVELRGADRKEVAAKVSEKLTLVGLEGRETQAVTTLSGGQQKRVAIARALAQDAECLMFDEPTAGLDPPISATVDDVIEQVNRDTGATCIVVTHDLISAFTVGTKLHLLHEGKVAESGTPEEFQASRNPIVTEFLSRGVGIEKHRTLSRTNVKKPRAQDGETTAPDAKKNN
ncbi:ATP-binding cassette domain-containing protein [Candidatus Sumerlaeota bacterium]|nr:ATP-binding cassette domain-containing protein [Candidatus Sumerlaeota bacterium]